MTLEHLNGHHRTALASLFRHPASHNVEWHDVLSLLKHIGTVTERHNGDFDVAINGRAIIIDRPRGHDLEGDQLRSLRHFLESAGLSQDNDTPSMPTSAPAGERAATCIVAVDRHHAKIFETCRENEATKRPIVLEPTDDGSRRRVTHRQGNDARDGGHATEEDAYYERIGADLVRATRIVVLSNGQGRSNAGDQLVAYLKRHHGDIAHRIVATDRVDISQLSDGEVVEVGLALVSA